MHTTSIH